MKFTKETNKGLIISILFWVIAIYTNPIIPKIIALSSILFLVVIDIWDKIIFIVKSKINEYKEAKKFQK